MKRKLRLLKATSRAVHTPMGTGPLTASLQGSGLIFLSGRTQQGVLIRRVMASLVLMCSSVTKMGKGKPVPRQ